MYYTVEWTIDIDSDRKRFEADEMAQFIFDLAHKEAFPKFGKILLKKLYFKY